MKRKFIWFSLVGLLAFSLIGKTEAFHGGSKPPGYNFNNYLKVLNIPLEKNFTKTKDVYVKGKLSVNKAVFEEYHIVVYGTGADTRQYNLNKWINGKKEGEYRFLGLSSSGVAIPNPNYVDDRNRGSNYLVDNSFAYQPWDTKRHPNLIKKSETSTHKSYFPSPRKNRISSYDKSLLGGAYETYGSENSPGDFLKENKAIGKKWLVSAPTNKFYNYTNSALHDYASVVMLPDKYTSGVFTIFNKASGCDMGYCYASFLIAPQNNTNDWIDFQCSNATNITPAPHISGGNVTKMNTVIKLNGNNTRRSYNANVTYYFEGSTVKYTKAVTLKAGKNVSLDLSTGVNTSTKKSERLKFPAAGTAKLIIEVKSEDMDNIEVAWNKKGNNKCQTNLSIINQNNASVELSPARTKVNGGTNFTGTFTVYNNFATDMIDAPTSTVKGHAQYHTTSDKMVTDNAKKAVVRLYKGTKLLDTTTYTYKDIKSKKTQTINISSKYIFMDAATDYKATVCIPTYMDSVTKIAEHKDDNCDSVNFAVTVAGDISVDLSGSTTYQAESDISLRYAIDNDYPQNHTSIPVTLTVTDLDTGKKTSTLTFNSDAIEMGDKLTDMTSEFQLPMGRYKAEIVIPNYPSEGNYENNKDAIEFTVLPFTPNNVECKVLDLDYVNIVEGDKGVSKFCIGQTPNYPSTTTEEGQGTFFFVLYRILPMPIPAYEVTNLDENGMYQLYSLNEASDEKGESNSFIFYPTSADNKKNLGGPYVAGPHEFYHHLYRGRMMPTEVTFDIKVQDPEGNNIPEASGKVYYKIDEAKCYDTVQLDIKNGDESENVASNSMDPCRQVYFYLPKETTDKMNVEDLKNTPKEEDRLKFKNPGVHTFDIKANEKQTYFYQKDSGEEWQGNETEEGDQYLRSPWNGEPLANAKGYVKTHTMKNGAWVIQDTYNNQCYSDNDAFDRVGKWVGTDFDNNNNVRNECFHNHGSDWHFWRYDWGTPSLYGPLE